MSFLDKVFEQSGENPVDKAQVIEVENPEVEPPTDDAPKEEPKVEETPAVEEPKAEEPKEPVLKEIDYKGFLEQNKETLKTYLNESDKDYKALGQEEVLRMKIKADNPDFDDNDVKDELAEKYGIGLEKKEIKDDMSTEEVAQINKENAEIDKLISKGKREMKKDAVSAVNFFEERKSTLELPKWIQEEANQVTEEQTGKFSPEEYQAEVQRITQENKEKIWVPSLDKVFENFDTLKQSVKYTDNGSEVAFDVEYKLSKEEKETIRQELVDYVAQPSDTKYVDANGNPDLQRFVEDKSKQLYFDKLISSAVKEASAHSRKDFVKNTLVNFDDGDRQKASGNDNGTTDKDFFKAHASSQKNKL